MATCVLADARDLLGKKRVNAERCGQTTYCVENHQYLKETGTRTSLPELLPKVNRFNVPSM